jgi:hypothetical protein
VLVLRPGVRAGTGVLRALLLGAGAGHGGRAGRRADVVHDRVRRRGRSPADLPVTYGLVRLDGADTVLLHVVLDVGDEPLEIGRRVEAVLRPVEDRTGSILDIEGFRPERAGT